jgi:hypothetical protein
MGLAFSPDNADAVVLCVWQLPQSLRTLRRHPASRPELLKRTGFYGRFQPPLLTEEHHEKDQQDNYQEAYSSKRPAGSYQGNDQERKAEGQGRNNHQR